MDVERKRKEFLKFMTRYLPDVNIQCIDDVVVDYIIVTANEEEMDTCQFIEMVSEYIPEFSTVDQNAVSELITNDSCKYQENNLSQNGDCSDHTVSVNKLCKEIDLEELYKMFPSLDVNDIHSIWSKFSGNVELCISELLEISNNLQETKDKNDTIKDYILSRYSYVESSKTYRPFLPKEEPKKLIRYRDNQVVSTKGERYSLKNNVESEEMKKTYVNLKPLRKYRFH